MSGFLFDIMDISQVLLWLLGFGNNVDSRTVSNEAVRHEAVRSSYTAAVYEHNVHLPTWETNTTLSRSRALEEMMVNIRVFQVKAKEAASQVTLLTSCTYIA